MRPSDRTKEAEELYLTQNHDPALSTIQIAIADMESIGIMATKLKDQALAWVYLIEWLAVSGGRLRLTCHFLRMGTRFRMF
jgi:hypothetical protein